MRLLRQVAALAIRVTGSEWLSAEITGRNRLKAACQWVGQLLHPNCGSVVKDGLMLRNLGYIFEREFKAQ